MINYTWKFPAIEAYPQQAGQTNVVSVVHWELTGIDSATSASAVRYGMQSISPYKSGSFTEYNELTPEQVTGWVTGSMGEEVYHAITGSIVNRIAEINAPLVTVLPPPWA
jgi:hypothetical protein